MQIGILLTFHLCSQNFLIVWPYSIIKSIIHCSSITNRRIARDSLTISRHTNTTPPWNFNIIFNPIIKSDWLKLYKHVLLSVTTEFVWMRIHSTKWYWNSTLVFPDGKYVSKATHGSYLLWNSAAINERMLPGYNILIGSITLIKHYKTHPCQQSSCHPINSIDR